MRTERIILAGGSGFLGTLLAQDQAARGREVIVLTRNPSQRTGPITEMGWDGRALGPWAEHLNGAMVVVNLTGRSVNCRYTTENQRLIMGSRVDATRIIRQAIMRCAPPPPL